MERAGTAAVGVLPKGIGPQIGQNGIIFRVVRKKTYKRPFVETEHQSVKTQGKPDKPLKMSSSKIE